MRITGLIPASGIVASTVTIGGEQFGAKQGASTVTFNGVAAKPTTWSDTTIVVPIPSGAKTGRLIVTVGPESSEANFTVKG